MFKKLSVLIPVYNEKNTIKTCVESVLNADTKGLELEVIISDNNSNDGTQEILNSFDDKRIKVLLRKQNNGKGAEKTKEAQKFIAAISPKNSRWIDAQNVANARSDFTELMGCTEQ